MQDNDGAALGPPLFHAASKLSAGFLILARRPEEEPRTLPGFP